MARLVSASFQNQTASDVDVDTPTFRRVIRKAIENLALVYDKITGSNGNTDVIDHSGESGRGAALGIPWINQTFGGRGDRAGLWGAELTYVSPPPAKGAGSLGSDTIIFGVPVFIPPGETDMTIRITGRGLDVWPWRVKLLKESDGTEIYNDVFQYRSGARSQTGAGTNGGGGLYELLEIGTNDNGTDGVGMLCILLIMADTTRLQTGVSTPDAQILVYSLTAGPTRIRDGHQPGIVRRSTDVFGVTDPGTSPVAFRDFDSTLFEDSRGAPDDDELPLHSYITAGANRNKNNLYEYITGWPAGGNENYVHEDNGDPDPTRSEFMAYTRAGAALEPQVAFPILAQAFGSFMEDGTPTNSSTAGVLANPDIGMLDWYPLIPFDAADHIVATFRAYLPDMKIGGTQKLKACVLAGNGRPTDVEGVKWQTSWDVGSGVSTPVPFATIGTTKLMTSKDADLDGSRDRDKLLHLHTEKTAAKIRNAELQIMGVCIYFEPPIV